MADAAHLRSLIERIHATNVVACNVPQVLDSLDITVSSVPSINLYLFELIQNALDARADSIAIVLNQPDATTCKTDLSLHSSCIFMHNGPGGLGNSDVHVKGMSNVFQSTKSVGSVGFMGFGFKTLYKRFSKVAVSDSVGWKFVFSVPEQRVHLTGSSKTLDHESAERESENIELMSRGWLGAVCPTWDDAIAPPAHPFTTRFEMSSLVSTTLSNPLIDDVSHALFSGDMMALAVLATQGLRTLRIETNSGENKNTLSFAMTYSPEDDGIVKVTQSASTNEKETTHFFRCLHVGFRPTLAGTKALAQARLKNILQHHKDVDRVIDDIRKTYRALGLVPLSSGSRDAFPLIHRGQLFASLPIRSFVPFGMSIQADWLLDLSRKGLRDVETNPWQQQIVQQISKLIALWLSDIPSRANSSRELITSLFSIFGCDPDLSGYAKTYAFDVTNFGRKIAAELAGAPIFPVISADSSSSSPSKIEFMAAEQVVLLPKTHYRPKRVSKLIGAGVVDESLIRPEAAQFFVNIGLLKLLDISDVIAKFSRDDGIGEWFGSLDRSEAARRDSLVELWAFLAEFAPSDSISQLKCVPSVFIHSSSAALPATAVTTSSWTWTSPTMLSVLEHESQYLDLPEDPLAQSFLKPSFPDDTRVLPPTFLKFLLKQSGDWNGPGRVAFEWIARHWTKRGLKLAARRAFMNARIPRSEIQSSESTSTILQALDRFEAANIQTTSGAEKIPSVCSLLAFSRWAASNKLNSLITHVLPAINTTKSDVGSDANSSTKDTNGEEFVKPIEVQLSVLGAPYVDPSLALLHTRLFRNWAPIHPIYASLSIETEKSDSSSSWSSTFTSLGAKGPVVLEEYVCKEMGVYPSYVESRKMVADILEISHDSVSDFQTTSRKGWKIVDTRFKDANLEQRSDMWSLVAHWLESNLNALERGDANLIGQGEVWRIYTAHGRIGTATWCQELNRIAWVPVIGKTNLQRPFETPREYVTLSPQLVRVLEKKGVFFGRTGAQKLLLDGIATFDASTFRSLQTSETAINSLTETLEKLVFVDSQQKLLVERALETAILPTISETAVAYPNLVRSDASLENTLGGFLTTTNVLPARLKDALHALDDRIVVNIPRWPTADQALRYFCSICQPAGASLRNIHVLPHMFECLASDQATLRSRLRRDSSFLLLPKLRDASTEYEWVPIGSLNASSIPLSMCGVSARVQRFVYEEICSAASSSKENQ